VLPPPDQALCRRLRREDRERDSVEIHVAHQWCLLGTARSEDEIHGLLEGDPRPRFELDHYRILRRHLAAGGARVVELGAHGGALGR